MNSLTMQKIFLAWCIFLGTTIHAFAETNVDIPFATGVDVSWCTEMEADGMRFYDLDGKETELLTLMEGIGMTAVRLRVWVNPETRYGAWSDKEDVLVKARRAHDAGLDIMIDFHYSDYFADPGKQTKPSAWVGLSYDGVKKALADHTKDVLQAIKDEGITVKWVQVGNETSGGMVYDDGRILWNTDQLDASWSRYADISNAGYDAVKEVFPEAIVIVHHDKGECDQAPFYQNFKQHGGKLDMIGLSYYPDWSDWKNTNAIAAKRLQSLYKSFRTPVMIVETGFSTWDTYKDGNSQTGDSQLAKEVFDDLVAILKTKSGCRGIFYWEPQVYGGWSHYIDDVTGEHVKDNGTYGKFVTCHGAFNKYGQPAPALLSLTGYVHVPSALPNTNIDTGEVHYYNLQGMPVGPDTRGLVIIKQGNTVRKVYRY